jgi:signal peptidase II
MRGMRVRAAGISCMNWQRIAPFAAATAIVIGDRITKIVIRDRVDPFVSISIVPEWLRIIHTENPGAAFGVMAEGNPVIRGTILIGVSALVLMFVVSALWRRTSSFTSTWARIGLALILGGAIGNLYDRVFRGTVTDFIEVYHGTWSFPAFNVADSAISVGAALLVIDLLRSRNKGMGEQPAGNL